jgi:hypothetical protein
MGDAVNGQELPAVDANTLARLVGASPKEIYDLAKAGVIERGAGRMFPLENSVRRYCEHARGHPRFDLGRSWGVCRGQVCQKVPARKTTQETGHMAAQTTALAKLKAQASPHAPERTQIWNMRVRTAAAA